MSVYLVTYDLKKPGRDYTNLLAAIRKHSNVQLSESSYAIVSAQTAKQVSDLMRQHMDANDHVYVVTLALPYSGFGPAETNQWLATNLR
jgi:hypothetical protein